MLRPASSTCQVGAVFLKQAIMCLTPDTPLCEEIDVVEGIDYETFWVKYMYPNKPVLIRGLTKGWRSEDWVRDGKPDFERLRKDFGEDQICVAKCGQQHFSDQARSQPTPNALIVNHIPAALRRPGREEHAP